MKTLFSLFIAASFALAAPALAADEPSADFAREVQGWFDGVAGPGNQLRVIVQPAAASAYSFLFDVTIQGKYEGRNVSIRGSLKVDREGKGARLTWTNAEAPLSRAGSRSCDFPVQRAGDGFEGRTLRDACMTAFQLPVPGTWNVRLEPGTITIRQLESGETLRFIKRLEEKREK